ncbi:MAG: c-type cytochrome [Burkholderiales bacterium]
MTSALRTRWLWAIAGIVFAAIGMRYWDILRSAFVFNPIPPTAQSIDRGRQLFRQDCSACHGADARGNGPAAAQLPQHPKDLTRIARPPIFPDGVVAYRIANGDHAMPAWKSVLSTEDIWHLINYIRSLRR